MFDFFIGVRRKILQVFKQKKKGNYNIYIAYVYCGNIFKVSFCSCVRYQFMDYIIFKVDVFLIFMIILGMNLIVF